MSAPVSKKRSLASAESPPCKVAKIHSCFAKNLAAVSESTSARTLRWLPPLGASQTCLHSVNLEPKSSSKVAIFDLDGTVIASLRDTPPLEWRWWNECVPAKLAEAAKDGYAIVLITSDGRFLLNDTHLNQWKQKLGLIADTIPNIPLRIFAAAAKDNFRKPMIGIWDELERIFAEDEIKIDKYASFYVGDHAGRRYPATDVKPDNAGTDRKWALNVGIPFFTPEEYFLGHDAHAEYALKGFHVSSLPSLPLFLPSSSPLIPEKPIQELVLFVGYPCAGKTRFFRQHFEPKGYRHIDDETLRTRGARAVRDALAAGLATGHKYVVDTTNRDVSKRQTWLDIGKTHNVPVRCMVFTASVDLAWHNNLYRSLCLPASVAEREAPRKLVPIDDFTSYENNYTEPQLSEGFTQIKRINWTFNGSEEERKVWGRWLQFDENKA
ncbi:polynucleotide kinase 3 phosphatase-domain-containing protein [Mycena amicta]|nr:polynucleotide kinase 3 phosphatase-domain-containing protein [Mycena amicta]